MSYRVLLVDDVADLRYLLRVVLETDGAFEIIGEAEDGKTAVEIAARTPPDVIVLDLSMPTMDGLEALPELRRLAPGAKIAVLSGFEGARLASSAADLGADAYFEKGTRPDAVLQAIKALLGLAPAPDANAGAGPDSTSGVTELAGVELAAMVAHDIRSPISTVVGFGDTLALRWDQLEDSKRRDLVAAMTAQARLVQAIADNLLGARAIDIDALDVDLQPHAPAGLLTDLSDVLTPICGDHPLELHVDPDLPVVLVDRICLTQILVNLVSNAARHAPPRSAILVAARADGAGVAVEVCDEGPGIPAADRARVLEKNVRLARDARGLGLGLYVASTFAKAMGGSLTIGDRSGGGARVTCRLQAAESSG